MGGLLRSKARASWRGGKMVEAHRVWEYERSQEPTTKNWNGELLGWSLCKVVSRNREDPAGMEAVSIRRGPHPQIHARLGHPGHWNLYLLLFIGETWKQNRSKVGDGPSVLESDLIEHGKGVLIFCEATIFQILFFKYIFPVFSVLSMLVYLLHTEPCEVDDTILILQRKNLGKSHVLPRGTQLVVKLGFEPTSIKPRYFLLFQVGLRMKWPSSLNPIKCY